MVLAGCIGMGLGLAFLIDLFLDRSMKRSSDIERHLRLPVFLSIPDTSWAGWLRLPSWLAGPRRVEEHRAKWGWRQRRPGRNRPGALGPGQSTADLHRGPARADHQLL